jgi:protein-L-isoaspartate(D-aspartate) O-methyltransferase
MQNTDRREQMIEHQVRAWEVLDPRVLEILRRVPRECFVPPQERHLAFADVAVPLPHGQHMLRPNVAGRALQALELTSTDNVLEVGTGSGFLTACLAAAAQHVRSLELFEELATMARANLAAVGVRNAEVVTADATRPLGEVRYHAIAITASLPLYDPHFERQLEIGGRLFAVVGEAPVMDARLIRRRSEDVWVTESLFETVLDPLINARRRESFAF